jgi:hypothetical protein
MSAQANTPISEQYRLIAHQWVDAEAAAELLEATKSAYLAKRMVALGDMPVSKAETIVKASDEWSDYLRKMIAAREKATGLKVQLEYLRMKHMEWQSENATRRAEMRL